MGKSWWRIPLGVALAPLILVAFWAWPYESNLATVLAAVWSYISFLVLASVCHLVLKHKRVTNGWHYSSLMFTVAFAVSFGISILAGFGYENYRSGQVLLVAHGFPTLQGLLHLALWCLAGALLYALSFFVFWFIAIRSRYVS